MALLLPKLRSHFAEFLNNTSPVSTLGFSPHPPVSVCGTGTYKTIAAFLDSQGPGLPYLCSVRVTSSDRAADLPTALLPRLHRDFHSRIPFPVCVPTVLFICGTGISTCYPSTTSFDLALGPDLPRADQLYSGNLRYSCTEGFSPSSRYSFRHSLFLAVHHSLRYGFIPLAMLLYQCLHIPKLRCRVSAPDIFGAGTLD